MTKTSKTNAADVARDLSTIRQLGLAQGSIAQGVEALKRLGKARQDEAQTEYTLGYLIGRLGLTEAKARELTARGAKRDAKQTAVLATARSLWRHVLNAAGFVTTKKQGGARKARTPKADGAADAPKAIDAVAIPTLKDGADADKFALAMRAVFAQVQKKNAKTIPADGLFMAMFRAMSNVGNVRTLTPGEAETERAKVVDAVKVAKAAA